MPKWPMTKSPRIWISWWQGEVKTGHLPIRIPVSRSPASSPPTEVSTDFIESEKVGRQAVSGRIFLLRSVFSPKTFSLSRLYNGRRRQRKQATDGKVDQKTKEKQHTASRILPVRMLFRYSVRRDIFLTAGWNGQAANCAPSRKINPFFRLLDNIRLCPVRFVGVPRPLSDRQSVFPRPLGLSLSAWQVLLHSVCCPVKAGRWFSPYFSLFSPYLLSVYP